VVLVVVFIAAFDTGVKIGVATVVILTIGSPRVNRNIRSHAAAVADFDVLVSGRVDEKDITVASGITPQLFALLGKGLLGIES
jgi:hypothetical protein